MRSNVCITVLSILFCTISLYAQAPDIIWTRTFGGIEDDEGYSVQQTTDGGYIIAGATRSYGAGYTDVFLVKTDPLGYSLWTNTFGGSQNDEGYSVQQTSDGGYIITGYTRSFGASFYDCYLIKTDSAGTELWAKMFGGSSNEYGSSVQQTTDGGYIIAGVTGSYGAGYNDIYLIKTNDNGDTQWETTFGTAYEDRGYCVQQTTDGGYIITGQRGPGCYLYLVKADCNGNEVWSKYYGEGGSTGTGYSVQQTTDGGYIITGIYKEYGGTYENMVLIKTDEYGNSEWFKTFGDYGGVSYSVQQTTDGGYIIAGSRGYSGSTTGCLVKTDSNGTELWTKFIGGSEFDQLRSVQQTSDGGYIVAGLTESFGAGSFDFFLVKLTSGSEVEETSEAAVNENYQVCLQSIGPNPFSDNLSIIYSIPEESTVKLSVVDISGRLIEQLVSEQLQAGTHSIIWAPSENVPSGCYLVVLNSGGLQEVGRCLKLN